MRSRTSAALDSLAEEIRALDRGVLALPVDVADWEQVSDFVGQVVERFGRIDRLAHSAGGNFEPGPLAGSDPAGRSLISRRARAWRRTRMTQRTMRRRRWRRRC